MKKLILFLFFILSILVPIGIVNADMAMPTTIKYYFQRDGIAYEKPLEFRIDCYGYAQGPPNFEVKEEGTYERKIVLSRPYEEGEMYNCSSYGCEIDGYNFLSAKNAHIDYCSFEIESEDGDFIATMRDISYENYCGNIYDDPIKCSMIVPMDYVAPFRGAPGPSDLDAVQNKTNIEGGVVEDGISLNPTPDGGGDNIVYDRTLTFEDLFLFALIFTIIIETIILLGMLKLLFKKESKELSVGKIVFTGVMASGITLPYLWFLLPSFLGGNLYVLVGEISVIIVETIIIGLMLKTKWSTAFIISVAANVVSYLLGLLLLPLIF